MAGVQFTELQSRPMEFLDVTSVTLDELQQLVPPFETAFHARMAAWRMDGHPRTARRVIVDNNCPLPSKWSRVACSAWSRGKPTSGFTCSCPRCWRRSAPLVMLLPAPARLWPSGSVSRRLPRRPWSHRWRRRLCLRSLVPPPPRCPPLCP
jgi:hypothetical protein